jgi:dTDP-4-amino-4,6-dideoxy-D-galactose acyltransferase
VTPEHLDLLRAYPYWPHAPRGVDAERVARFAAGLLTPGAVHEERSGAGALDGFYVRQDLPWDSEKLGLKSARVSFVWSEPSVCARLCRCAVEHGRRDGYGYLFTRIDARDLDVVQACEKAGLVVVDSILSQYIQVETAPELGEAARGITLREAGPSDAALMEDLVGATLTRSRFHDDPKVGPERGREIYREWARNSVNGLNDYTVIAEVNGEPASFLSVKDVPAARGGFGFGYGRIEIVGVLPRHRGIGLVQAMTAALVRACPRLDWQRLGVGTQVWNVAAIRGYQKAGFTPGDAIFSMRWRVDD